MPGGQWGGARRTPGSPSLPRFAQGRTAGRTAGSCPKIPENGLPKRRSDQHGSHRNTPLTQITRTQEHARQTSRAHLCDYRGAGGRMCVMVAQHSLCFVLVLRVP